jgi:cytochrome c biogenesis protein CcmG, thiol:disulfide interchange protein DsbE
METHYQLLGISEQASTHEIEAAYDEQRVRYSPERVADLDEEVRVRAVERTAQIEAAKATLIDPDRRRAYNDQLAAGRVGAKPRAAQTTVTRREIAMAAGGALVGLALIAIVWIFAGQTAEPALPPVGEVSRPAPEFALQSLDGTTVRLSDYRGKVVLINFWGTWCEPCKEETPALQAAYAELQPRGFEVIGVNLYSQETGGDAGVREFLAPYRVSYPIALDSDGETARSFQISPIPVSYFVDPSGNIRFVKVGALPAAEVRTLFERLQTQASVASS